MNLEQVLSQTPHFQYIHERLFTSGQPSAIQLQHIKEYGISTVINIALSTSPDHLAHEDQICLDLGLNYIQLPILWDMPNPEQAIFALDTINFLVQEQLVWIHCSDNYRVSVLMYLYRKFYMDIEQDVAHEQLEQVWQPNDTWTGLMHSVALQLQGRKATHELQQSMIQHNDSY